MKHITTYILAMGIGLAGLTSCSDSWLETNSTQATEGNTLFATTSNAVWQSMDFVVPWFSSIVIMDKVLTGKVQ